MKQKNPSQGPETQLSNGTEILFEALNDLPRGVFPVRVRGDAKNYSPQYIDVFKGKNKDNVKQKGHEYKVRVDSAPVCHDYACTGHSLQGMSLTDLVILGLGKLGNNRSGYPYMLITRVRDIKQVRLVHKLKTDLKYYPKRKELIDALRLNRPVT